MPTSCLSAGAQQVAYIATQNCHKHVSSSLGGRAAGSEVAKQMIDVYLSTRWEGETNERHASRVVSILPFTLHIWRSCARSSVLPLHPWWNVYSISRLRTFYFAFILSRNLIFRSQRKIHELEKKSTE